MTLPPVPGFLAHLTQVGGIVVPFTAPAEGLNRERVAHSDPERVSLCAKQHRCMLCGEKFDKGEPFAIVLYESAGVGDCSSDPWLHVRCAEYTFAACPFLSGRRHDQVIRGDQATRDFLNAKVRTFRLLIGRKRSAHEIRGEWHFQVHDVIEERQMRAA